MKKLIILLVILSISVLTSHADDYLDKIPVNPTKYTKCEKCTAVLKSKLTNSEFWYDRKKWKYIKDWNNSKNGSEEYYKFSYLHSAVIYSKLGISKEDNENIEMDKLIENRLETIFIKSNRITKEIRIINNNKVIYYEYMSDIDTETIKTYLVCSFPRNSYGVIMQLSIYAEFDSKYQPDIQQFLSGLVVK